MMVLLRIMSFFLEESSKHRMLEKHLYRIHGKAEWTSSLVVPVFQKGDDPIDAINHMMSFLTAVVTSRKSTQTTYAAGTTRKYTPGASGSNTGKQRTVICYNCKGEGHIAKQCTKPKRKRDETWFNDKVLLVQAQASGQALTEEEIAFLADPGLPDVQTSQTVITHHCCYQADDLDAYDFDCDELNSAKIALMANLSRNGSDALTEVLNPDNLTYDLLNQSEQIMTSSEQSNDLSQSETEKYDSNSFLFRSNEQYAEIVRLKQNLFEQVQEKDSLMKTVSELKNELKSEENRNIDREIALEKKIKQLDNIIFKRAQYQANDKSIVQLKEQLSPLNGNLDDHTVKMDHGCEIEDSNIELNIEVTKLVAGEMSIFLPVGLTKKKEDKKGVRLSTSASGSQPSGNTRNDRIPQTPSSNSKNKVEDPRNV
ncbi:retrovirus-related pol polyprotein from transposon TNT 1-94 [Tanacetum coccineum]